MCIIPLGWTAAWRGRKGAGERPAAQPPIDRSTDRPTFLRCCAAVIMSGWVQGYDVAWHGMVGGVRRLDSRLYVCSSTTHTSLERFIGCLYVSVRCDLPLPLSVCVAV
uniref:Uncharacterized protein n=1 Tax=Vitrella brassicaformis TaxID=1169539 RepID=A0A7S1NY12_9ALVE